MKSFVALAVVALFAAASAGHVAPKNIITDIIKNIIENNRDKMANINVPLIDLGEFGTVQNLTVTGVDKFVLEKLDAAGPLSVDIKNATITLAEGIATAHLESNNVAIPEIGLIVNGVGELSGVLNGLFATVSLDLSLDGLKPVLEDFSNLYISIASVQATITGEIDNVDDVNNTLNTKLTAYLNENLVILAEAKKPEIIEAINKVLDGIISKH